MKNILNNDRYVIIKEIGRGTSSKAYLAHDRVTRNEVAIKEVHFDLLHSSKERELARKEVSLLSKLDHPNIIKYLDHFDEKGMLYLVMEYADGGDLHSFLRKRKDLDYLKEGQLLSIFIQIVLALNYLHEQRVLHRDVKTRNIFMYSNSNTVKLGDFGISRVLEETIDQARTSIGTPYYLSPEICESKPYNEKSDCWALGCVLYEMCTLKHPFDASTIKSLMAKITRGIYPPIPSLYSSNLKQLIDRLLYRKPEDRPTTADILALPFIQQKSLIYVTHQRQSNVIRQLKDDISIQAIPIDEKDLTSRYLKLCKRYHFILNRLSLGEEKAFRIMAQFLFGNVPVETIISKFRKSDSESFIEIVRHIQSSLNETSEKIHDEMSNLRIHKSNIEEEFDDYPSFKGKILRFPESISNWDYLEHLRIFIADYIGVPALIEAYKWLQKDKAWLQSDVFLNKIANESNCRVNDCQDICQLILWLIQREKQLENE
ncbi:Protein kinase, catalytic domain-containing protein [Rozella allomycis CSF55]|uniref:non-specific serine/threonine protein kinase n=1 Tax=Rozella allomycis (strain CSF55) TaxID=988480 RepID=A0A075ANI7_ROZAC|nr:Protein kinase, catalytic domain-containing protein [Rozella allomycis CSF55]|eukprot:EPZ31422.1 Protein kinase, catalytic domain-containing protein [Rozella allomycis CSF55]